MIFAACAVLAFKDASVRVTPDMLRDPRVQTMFASLVETAPPTYGNVVLVTSAHDGHHMQGSRHYDGLALDVRTVGVRLGAPIHESPAVWAARLRARLGPDYDVVDEGNHLHLEWNPKG